MAMVRKQLYIAPEQQQKLRALAARWRCTEAEVMRTALDRLPDPTDPILRRLVDAGPLVPPPEDEDPPTPAEIAALEDEIETWTSTRAEPLGLADAVLEDRR